MTLHFFLAFIIYFSALLFIGFIAHKKNAGASEMLVGGRGLNFWVTALSAQASDMSSWLFMAFPMAVMLQGMPYIWTAIGLIIGMFASWHFIAPRLRIETEKHHAYTLSTYLARRYKDTKGTIRLLSSGFSLIFLTYYLAAGLISIGILFETIFGIDYYTGIAIASLVIMGYTFIGGFVSVAWVDVFQAIFLLVAILIVPVFAFLKIGSIEAIVHAADAAKVSLSFFPDNLKEILNISLGWGLGYFGMPHVVNKFMGIKDPKELVKSKYLGISWEILAFLAATCIGLIGIAYFSSGIANPQLIFVYMVRDLFHPFFAALVLCGVFAATISTMDSQLLVAATTITEDIYKQIFSKDAGSKQEVRVFRAAVVLVTMIAIYIAGFKNKSIMETVYYAWAGLGCTFAPIVIASLYSDKVNRYGAVSGILVGGLTAAVWPYLGIPGNVLAMIPGFFLSLVAIFGVSALTRDSDTGTNDYHI